MKSKFKTADEFTEYLNGTLIPDLHESGSDATAYDFEDAVHWIREEREKTAALVKVLKSAQILLEESEDMVVEIADAIEGVNIKTIRREI